MDKEDAETIVECIEIIEDLDGVEASWLTAKLHIKVKKNIVENKETWHTMRERKVSEEEIESLLEKLQDEVNYLGTVDGMSDGYDEDRIDFYYR